MGTLGTFISGEYFLWHLYELIVTGVYESIKKHGLAIDLVTGG